MSYLGTLSRCQCFSSGDKSEDNNEKGSVVQHGGFVVAFAKDEGRDLCSYLD